MTPERFHTLKAALVRRQPDLTVLADHVHKPHNVSALIRTCDAVGVYEVNAVAPDGAFARQHMISGGTRGWVRVRVHRELAFAVDQLKILHFQLIAAHFSIRSVDYRSLDYTRPTAFLMGSELTGVSAEAAALADHHTVIPMRGLVASLNVSVAAALLLYEAARQREAAGLYQQSRLEPAAFQNTLFEWCYPGIAARCRARNLAYPPLDKDGELTVNPFQPAGTAAGAAGPAGECAP